MAPQAQIVPAKMTGQIIHPLGAIPKKADVFVVYFAKPFSKKVLTEKERLEKTSKEVAVLLKKLDKKGLLNTSIDDQLADV